MLKRFGVLLILVLASTSVVSADGIYTQNEPKGFVRIGLGAPDFESHNSASARGELHYHEAAFTAGLGLGYGVEYFRAMILFDHAIGDGVQGASVISVGLKGEAGLPRMKWLKLGGGVMYSSNHAKLGDDIELYEKGPSDRVLSPFASVTFVPGAGHAARFFGEIRIGRSYGGDVIQPATGKPVAGSYFSIGLGIHLRPKD